MKWKTIWISDVHLGTRGCKSHHLLEFLRDNDAETIFLVGDIIDGWRLKSKLYWPQEHNDVVQKILRKVRKGTEVIYIAGNHDEFLRNYIGYEFGGIKICDETEYDAIDGRRFLILHGDRFDGIVRYHKWLAILGDIAYTILLKLNNIVSLIRRKMGFPYWSLSAFLKSKTKEAVNFVYDYENTISSECERRGFDGIITGHIHTPAIKQIDSITYMNCGDWVENCTALVEDYSGAIKLLHMIK